MIDGLKCRIINLSDSLTGKFTNPVAPYYKKKLTFIEMNHFNHYFLCSLHSVAQSQLGGVLRLLWMSSQDFVLHGGGGCQHSFAWGSCCTDDAGCCPVWSAAFPGSSPQLQFLLSPAPCQQQNRMLIFAFWQAPLHFFLSVIQISYFIEIENGKKRVWINVCPHTFFFSWIQKAFSTFCHQA